MLEAQLNPLNASDGQFIVCEVTDLPDAVIGDAVEITLAATDGISSHWVASTSGTVGANRTVTAQLQLSLGREAVVRLVRILSRSDSSEREWGQEDLGDVVVLLNGVGVSSTADVVSRERELLEAQELRFGVALGDCAAPCLFRVVCVYERLLTRTRLRLPGAVKFRCNAATRVRAMP